MRRISGLVIGLTLLLVSPALSVSQVPSPKSPPIINSSIILHNSDVLLLVKRGVKANQIISHIKSSRCSFDIFPPVLDDLKRRGVPDSVLAVMATVPNGPPLSNTDAAPAPAATETLNVKLPRGVGVLVETLYPVSSADFHEGNTIAFAVVRPVYVDGVLVIARGTVARARISQLKKAQSWGRGGALTWEMEFIPAVDGTRIPVQLSAAAEGDNRGGQLAAGVAVTSALIFPYTAPAALVWGFKKGDDAVVRGSKQFAAIIKDDIEITGMVPEKDKVIYHYAEALKAKMNNSSAAPTAFPRMGVRN